MPYTQQYGNLTDNFNMDDKFKSNEWNEDWGNADVNNQNYIDWITYDDKQNQEYKNGTFYFENNNNNVAATSQENIFTNENQNNIDILAASTEFYDENIENKNYNDISIPIDQQTTCAENLSKYLSEIDENNNEEAPEENSYNIPMNNMYSRKYTSSLEPINETDASEEGFEAEKTIDYEDSPKDTKYYQISKQEEFTIDEVPLDRNEQNFTIDNEEQKDNMRRKIKNKKALQINDHENGAFDIFYTP